MKLVSELRITGREFKTTPDLFPDMNAIAQEGLGEALTRVPTVPTVVCHKVRSGATAVGDMGLTPTVSPAWSGRLMGVEGEQDTRRTQRK